MSRNKSNSNETQDESPTAPFWMTTFSDMVTLLMVFFVLIVSMSEVNVKKFRKALTYFRGNTGVLANPSSIPSPPSVPRAENSEMNRTRAKSYEELLEKLEEQGLDQKIQVDLTDEGIHITITDSVMFRSGEANLIEPSKTILRTLSSILTAEVRSVVVEGHTDNQPIHTEVYPSNWELSTARAAAVIRFLQQHNDRLSPDRYAAIGFGEYHPRDTNESSRGRARNRRVEILLSWKPWLTQQTPLSKKLPKN